MLTIAWRVLQLPPPAAEPTQGDVFLWLFHPPSLYTIADLVITGCLLLALLLLWRRKVTPDAGLRRAVERVVLRLDQLELEATRREERHQEFRTTLIEINEQLLAERTRGNNLSETMLARVEYAVKTLEQRPCFLPDGDCPDGHVEEEK